MLQTAMESMLEAPAYVYRWRKDAAENPYFGYLALADRLIVTCDSMSMLTEAIVTRKPVFIYDLLRGAGSNRPPLPPKSGITPLSPVERLREPRAVGLGEDAI